MINLIDDTENDYKSIYWSEKVSNLPHISFPDECWFNSCNELKNVYIRNSWRYKKFRTQIQHFLEHYLSIVRHKYNDNSDKFIDHIPKDMRSVLKNCNAILKYNTHTFPFEYTDISSKCYEEIKFRHPKRYECENSFFYVKSINVFGYYSIEWKSGIFVRVKTKPKTLIQLAAQALVNSDQWVHTSMLEIIEYNFKDLYLCCAFKPSETYLLYDILLVKFMFQHFFQRERFGYSTYASVCKCTFGLKNRNHVKTDSPEVLMQINTTKYT